jgi:hypothetical protein
MGILWLNKVRVKIVLISSAFMHQPFCTKVYPVSKGSARRKVGGSGVRVRGLGRSLSLSKGRSELALDPNG